MRRPSSVRLGWLLAVALGASGCARGPSTDLDGVVLIVVDTLRADRIGAYGHAAATTPHLDALAARGRVFTEATTPAPVTLPAVTSLLTGMRPTTHGVRDNDGFVLDPTVPTLAERFAAAGWRTGAVLGAAVLASDRGLARGFELYDEDFADDDYPVYRAHLAPLAERLSATRRRAPAVNARALRWLESVRGEPFFLMVHYFDVHAPYDPPPRFDEAHPGEPYDGGIAATDAAIGELLGALPPRTLVILVADHGEGLGEHGESEHGFLLYQSTLHVPLMIAGPDVTPGRFATPVGLVDVAPTLADRCGLRPLDGADGRRLPLDDDDAFEARDGLYAETLRPLIAYGWQELRAWRAGSHKIVAARTTTELYDLALDPHETVDRSDDDAAETEAMRRRLERVVADEDAEAILARAQRRMQSEPERSELLASLGYVGGDGSGADVDRPHPRQALPRWVDRQRDKARARTAAVWIDQGRAGEAIALLDTLLREEPDRADLLHHRARAAFALADSARATEDLLASLRSDPVYVPSLRLRAEQLLRSGDFSRAVELLERLARVAPDDADSRYNLGVAWIRLGRPDRARPHLDAFLRAQPNDPRANTIRQWMQSAGRE